MSNDTATGIISDQKLNREVIQKLKDEVLQNYGKYRYSFDKDDMDIFDEYKTHTIKFVESILGNEKSENNKTEFPDKYIILFLSEQGWDISNLKCVGEITSEWINDNVNNSIIIRFHISLLNDVSRIHFEITLPE